MDRLCVLLRQPREPLVRYAAEEIQRYVRLLFGLHPPIRAGGDGDAEATIIVGGSPVQRLSEQGYEIGPTGGAGKPGLVVAGGSPRATLWAAYEMISAWGVRFLVQGDVLPESAGPFRLPDLRVRREPVFVRREFRVLNDMANSGIFWGLEDHRKLFDQLAKLRFTGIRIQTYAHQPWAHYSFGGVERCTGGLCYGWDHPIHPEMIGRELFGKGPLHTNPEFEGARTYEESLACGRRLMRGIFDAARARGLEVTYCHALSEVPDEFVPSLMELSKGVELPPCDFHQPHYSRHGLTFIGGPAELERLRTPLNPVYVDLMEATTVAHIQAYPDADYYELTESEFPPGGAGARACWDQLNRKYHLEPQFSFDQITERAGKQFFYSEGRALAQALGAIQTLRLVDILVNERQVLRHSINPKAKVLLNFFSEHLQPLVEHVLPPERCEFVAIVDYLPARVAERMHTLEFAKTGKLNVTLITTVEDDNVGFLPQMVTQALHKTVQKMREYNVKGYCFRQFDISQHEPAMAYLIESAWDASVTPEQTYARYARDVAGEAAAADLLAAFAGVEDLNEAANAMMGLAFLFPGIYRNHWSEGSKPTPAWIEYTEKLKPIEQRLSSALEKSAPRGRRLVGNYLNFIVFAGQFVRMIDRIRQAREVYDQAQKCKKGQDVLAHHPLALRASKLLFEAIDESQTALRTWARQVVNPTDLGTLAALNAYGHDALKGIATLVYWETHQYGFSL